MNYEGLCQFLDCSGKLEDGYCNVCGRAPRKNAGSTASGPGYLRVGANSQGQNGPGSGRTSRRMPTLRPTSTRMGPKRGGTTLRLESSRTSSRRTGSTRLGLGLVQVPSVPTGDPADAVMAKAEVPEDKRYCSKCGNPVGRSRRGRPGRTEGFCPSCRSHFSFTPKLIPGDLLAGQYEVLGAIAHGGLGWIYLARDKAVSDRWVVLKGLLDTSSEDAALAAVAERRFLAALDHANIVQIYNFVTYEGAGYIVMEYVGGKSLKTILKERREANAGVIDPLPCDQAIAYVLGILPAMGYLHENGMVYCDMKPDNIVLMGDSLKIIDVGGVRRLDDQHAAIYGTAGYQAPEVPVTGPTLASDLYTVGRTLAVLTMDFRGYQSSYVDSLPPPDEQPLLAQRESLHRYLLKATAYDPEDRFGSAEEMAEQLLGILREDAAQRGTAQPAVSSYFGPDGVLEMKGQDEVRPDWRLLPRPKVDPLDPGAGLLENLADEDPYHVMSTLKAMLDDDNQPVTTEIVVALARAHLDEAMPEHAGLTLDNLGDLRDWRLWWHRGLTALAQGKAVDAVEWFDPVYTDLPGEVAPKLALAIAHELAGELARSADLYDRTCTTDPSHVSAAFGLARVCLAMGERQAAVQSLERVPVSSSLYNDARMAAVRALVGKLGDNAPMPTIDQVIQAGERLQKLHLDPRRRGRLEIEVFEAALAALPKGAMTARSVLGRGLQEAALRKGMEASYRELARLAGSRRERQDLVDIANQVRPRTLV